MNRRLCAASGEHGQTKREAERKLAGARVHAIALALPPAHESANSKLSAALALNKNIFS